MSGPEPLVYVERATGRLCHEPVYARGLLDWLYNTRAGGAVAILLTRSVWASRLYGRLQRTRWSRARIRPFVERMGIDLGGCAKPIEAFASFSDFFEREPAVGARPIAPGTDVLVSPADARALVFPHVEAGSELRIKRARLRLAGLLGDPELAAAFDGGALAVLRLGLADYHHVHFPTAGVPAAARSIPGRYEATGPYPRRRLLPFYSENHRMVTRFASERFGVMALVEVGALTVGSIRQHFAPGRPAAKGARKAAFGLGGSTVVVAFERGTVSFDRDLLDWSARGLETGLRLGERMGLAARRPPAAEAA